MSKINKNRAFIIGTDSDETMRKKIAFDRKTLPQYIAIENDSGGRSDHTGEDIIYTNITDIAENYDTEIQYPEFYKHTQTKWKELTPIDNLKVWLYVIRQRYTLMGNSIEPTTLLQVIQSSIPVFMNDYKQQTVTLIGMSEKRLKREVKDEIVKFATTYRKEYENIEKFYKLRGIESTEFSLDRSNFQITIMNPLQYNNLDIFDKITTSVLSPFCKVYNFTENKEHGFTKIYRNIEPPEEWIIGYEDTAKLQNNIDQTLKNYQGGASTQTERVQSDSGLIMIKLLSTDKFKEGKMLDQYTDVEIIVRPDRIIITMQTITNKGIDQEETLGRVSETLGIDVGVIGGAINVSIAGTFFYPSQLLNLDIFSDMVMNNPIFSQYLKIDENIKLQKKKNQVYCYFLDKNNPGANNRNTVTANITNQIVEKRDPAIRTQIDKKDHSKFPPNSNYIRIRITRTNTLESLSIFQAALSKLLTLYNIEKDDVVRFYERYLGPGVLEKTGKKVVKTTDKVFLKDIDPELFDPRMSNYSRQCQPKFQPRIVNDTDAEQLRADGKEVMKYPKPDAYGDARNYVCDRAENIASKHTYPGVKVNNYNQQHIKKYPVLPCCYTKPQQNTKAWREYYDKKLSTGDSDIAHGDRTGDDEDEQGGDEDHGPALGRVIQGVKFLQIDQMGELPKNIKKLLESYDDNYKYYRRGASLVGSPNSFLECCLQLFDIDFQETFGVGKQTTRTELNEFIIAKRVEIAQSSTLETIRQENYEFSVDEIYTNILNPNIYFDPHRYIRLVEDKYKINIILFSRINTLDGTYSVPHHSMNYLRWNQQYDKTIMIYEHSGSEEVDATDFPHCELIVMSNVLNGVKDLNAQDILMYSITSDVPLFGQLGELTIIMNKSYNLATPSTPFEAFPGCTCSTGVGASSTQNTCSHRLKLLSQYIDHQGKTRIINVNYNGTPFSLMTNPLPNLSIPETNIIKSSQSVDLSTAIELIQYLGARIVSKTCYTKQTPILPLASKSGATVAASQQSSCKELRAKLPGDLSNSISVTMSIKGVGPTGKGPHGVADGDAQQQLLCGNISIPNIMQEFVTNYESDKLENFRYMKNVADWVMEYNFWLFSKYCHDNHIMLATEFEQLDLNINVLNRYVDDRVIFIDNYRYEKPSQIFSETSTIMRDGKLIISGAGEPIVARANAQDILQRLIYTLRLKQQSLSIINGAENTNSLQYYYKKILVNNYYTAASDFTKKPDEIIFPSLYSLQTNILQQRQEIQLFNNIEPDISYPYLLQSELTENHITLCHNTNNLTHAYNIALVWNQQKFNPIEPITESIPLGPFTLILQTDRRQNTDNGAGPSHERIKIGSETTGVADQSLSDQAMSNSMEINIVGYLLEGTPQYTVLLFL